MSKAGQRLIQAAKEAAEIYKRASEITYPPELLPRYEDGGDVFVCDGNNAHFIPKASTVS
jgi:hypothetical protein